MPRKKTVTKKNAADAGDRLSLLQVDISLGKVSFSEKSLFAKHLSVMLKSGMTLSDALRVTKDSAKGGFKRVLKDVLRSVQSGRSLSDALKRHPRVFSELFVAAVFAGEASGTLVQNLSHLADELEKEKELHQKIKGALMYPSVVLIATAILGFALAFLVLPKITPLFTGLQVDLPFTTRALIWAANLAQENGLLIAVVTIVVVVGLVWLVRQKFSRPVTHWITLHIPVIKHLVRHAALARFCRTLGTLLGSGLTIGEALDVSQRTIGNYYYARSLQSIAKRVSKGSRLSSNLEKFEKLYPLAIVRMVSVGEESGNMEETLHYLADFYDSEVDTATKALSTALEPILLIVVGVVVGFLALSIITPIYDITGSIQR